MKRFLVPVAITATLVALAGACSSEPDRANPSDRTTGTTPPVQLVAALQSNDSCEALLAWIKAEARTRVGPYGFDGGIVAMEGDMAVSGAARSSAGFAAEDSAGETNTTMAAEPATSTELDAAAGDDGSKAATTGTNNQEVGVDEIDRFKTDGRHVVMADDQGRLLAIDITGATPRKLGELDLDMYGVQLFLDGDRVVAVGTPNSPERNGIYREQVAIVRIALGDGTPVVTSRAAVDGSFVSGRMTGESIRLVLATHGPDFGFVVPNTGDERPMQVALEANRRIIDESTLDDWLPGWTSPGGAEGQLIDCGSVFHPESWSGSSVLSVVTLGDDLADLDPVAVIGGGETVYSSPTGLYVATQVWPTTVWDEHGQPVVSDEQEIPTEKTAIHRFDAAIAGTTTYQGSGNVPGHVLNQYAMSERNGDLRVATTVDGGWWGGRPIPMPMPVECPDCAVSSPAVASEVAPETTAADASVPANRSLLTVLRLRGSQLEQVGQVDGLGPNEQIQAVRYVEDRAYVVTFRRTDPLYVIDLADPTAPKVLGELKEPGFSAYLHPIGQDRMLGIGSSGTDDGRITGAKVALYDTSDPTNPRAVATLPIQDGYSSAGGDSHAFTWDSERKLAFIPMSLQPSFDDRSSVYVEPIAGVAVYRVDGDAVTWVGWIDHSKHAVQPTGGGGGVGYCPPNADCVATDDMSMPAYTSPVDRTAVVGDRVLAASMAGVSQVAVDGFAETGWVGWD